MATPFDPIPIDTTQNEIDQANVQAALNWCAQIEKTAKAHRAADEAFLTVISRLNLPIDTETQGLVAADLHHQDDVLRADGYAEKPKDYTGYASQVNAWGSQIVTNRSIAANPANANNEEVQSRIIFPAPPQILVDYAAASGIPKLRIIKI